MMNDRAYALFEEQQKDRGISLSEVKEKLKALKIETLHGDTGTRARASKCFSKRAYRGIRLKKWKMHQSFTN